MAQLVWSTATQPHVGFLWRGAEGRRLPFRHLNARRPRLGCLMEPIKVEALKAVSRDGLLPDTTRDGLLPDTRHKDKQSGVPEMINAIRAGLRSMGEGEINVSAYDTAWVALVKSLNGDDAPQFPSCIDWIARNQLPDGSWGDDMFFLVQDRIINTLACIIALKSWDVHDYAFKKGLSFISENMWRVTKDDENWTLSGFEIIFPMLIEKAKDLGINIPLDDPTLEAIYAKRELKLTKVPREAVHAVPTTFLLSLEGMPGLDWKMLRKLQCPDGSFMSSPAPTAYALMKTGDPKCFEFLDRLVGKYNGSVPFVYPIEMFERLWIVDRLERLGISRYFKSEIEDYLEYVYRHWSDEGLSFTKGCPVKDIDDTAMGFRLLRLHGYPASPCAFKRFENDGQFVCYPRQSNQSVSAMYNLYRAADQASFPGDGHVLGRARSYSRAFLRERRASDQLNDKWIISEGHVRSGFPWEASLPRIETRMYLEQYGGSDDVWIGKVLYRMNLISNDAYLKAAKADFSNFQRLCRLEWLSLKRWCDENNLEMYGVTPQSALRAYFLAAASIFEPGRAAERLGWARAAVLAEAISGCLLMSSNTHDDRKVTAEWLIDEFVNSDDEKPASGGGKKNSQVTSSLAYALRDLIDIHASDDASVADCLRGAWKEWFMAWTKTEREGPRSADTALLLVRTVEICSGRHHSTEQDLKLLPDYSKLEQLTRSICCRLATEAPALTGENMDKIDELDRNVGFEMQELAQCVFQSCSSINRVTRQTFLHVTKRYYYVALCSPETIEHHISKVIFEDVV
ncbi:unnamed protein product [Miscanthus lutarioriparius]|uniref:Terpene synthase N-terminal domain-containing protein n=1 Tax=Miscanthus lutarioriparius TaxID=422564 RepID=A0A811Q5Q8_9POAL|nr:unnamed protein product [Miscanthus lutarioriparius]